LGFSAILLADTPGYDDLGYRIPGTPTEQAALGTLHANCGGCHHPRSDVQSNTPMILRLSTTNLNSVATTGVYSSTVGVMGMTNSGEGVTALIQPGNPAASAVSVRMGTRGNQRQMPPVASKEVDTVGKAAVDAWITSLGM